MRIGVGQNMCKDVGDDIHEKCVSLKFCHNASRRANSGKAGAVGNVGHVICEGGERESLNLL
jgi:hypothetical protein